MTVPCVACGEPTEEVIGFNTPRHRFWTECIAALRARVERVEGAARPFASGGEWGKWKAWLVEGARVLDKLSEGLDGAQAITRWQVRVDAALLPPTPAAP